MINDYSVKTRNLLSTIFIVFFFILLLIYTAYIEFFQDTQSQLSATNLLENPIQKRILKNTISLRFKNRIGEFSMKKENDNWILQEPRVIPAKNSTINNIIRSLEAIKIHTVHEYEPINFQSFSLDKPIIEMDLYTKLNEKYNIKIGLMNPINNTSYMTVSGQDRIFQTNLFKGNLEKLELSDFIDSQIFSPKVSQVQQFELYQGENTSATNIFSKVGDTWKTKKYKVISNERLEAKLNAIFNIKTHMIIDKTDEETNNFINNYLKNPLYRVSIKLSNGETLTYKISSLIKNLPELKLEKRQFFIVSASNRKYPYIINKTYLEEFQIRYSDLKPE